MGPRTLVAVIRSSRSSRSSSNGPIQPVPELTTSTSRRSSGLEVALDHGRRTSRLGDVGDDGDRLADAGCVPVVIQEVVHRPGQPWTVPTGESEVVALTPQPTGHGESDARRATDHERRSGVGGSVGRGHERGQLPTGL